MFRSKIFWFLLSWIGLFLLSLSVGYETYAAMPTANKALLVLVGVFNQVVGYIDGRLAASR